MSGHKLLALAALALIAATAWAQDEAAVRVPRWISAAQLPAVQGGSAALLPRGGTRRFGGAAPPTPGASTWAHRFTSRIGQPESKSPSHALLQCDPVALSDLRSQLEAAQASRSSCTEEAAGLKGKLQQVRVDTSPEHKSSRPSVLSGRFSWWGGHGYLLIQNLAPRATLPVSSK